MPFQQRIFVIFIFSNAREDDRCLMNHKKNSLKFAARNSIMFETNDNDCDGGNGLIRILIGKLGELALLLFCEGFKLAFVKSDVASVDINYLIQNANFSIFYRTKLDDSLC